MLKTLYIKVFLNAIIRSALAFTFASSPSILVSFGFGAEQVVGGLAIGDLLMGAVKAIEEPYTLWKSRTDVTRGDLEVRGKDLDVEYLTMLLHFQPLWDFKATSLYCWLRMNQRSMSDRLDTFVPKIPAHVQIG